MSTISKNALTLVATILATAQKLGLTVERELSNDSTLPENSGFIKVRVDGGSAELNLPKGHTKWCDSHVDWSGKPGYINHPGGGGAVVCRIDLAKADLGAVLTALSGASKRDRKASSSKSASQSTAELIAALKSMGLKPDSQPASEAPVAMAGMVASVDDPEESDGEFSEAS